METARLNKSGLLVVLFFIFNFLSFGFTDNLFAQQTEQEFTVSGTVVSAEDREALPGATIVVKVERAAPSISSFQTAGPLQLKLHVLPVDMNKMRGTVRAIFHVLPINI